MYGKPPMTAIHCKPIPCNETGFPYVHLSTRLAKCLDRKALGDDLNADHNS